MALPKNILYPVDFSDRCRGVWPVVSEMGRRLGAPITILHALDLDFRNGVDASSLQTIRDHLKEELGLFPESNIPNIRRELVDGPAAECIVRFASQIEAPLIMMPTRGHTRFRQLLLGSVTAAVLHDAVCPVWTEAHTEDGSTQARAPRSIVCAIDMGARTAEILQRASEFNTKFGSFLHVVHSVPGIDPRFPSGAASRAHRFLVDKAQEDFTKQCGETEFATALEIVEDVGLVDGILGAAARHRADLLLIGRGVIQGPLGRLRTNAHELIRRSPCPVLSV